MDTHPSVPYPSAYWVVPGQFLAGEHPGDVHQPDIEERLGALLAAGIRTFVDLTEEHETHGYAILVHGLAQERGLEVTYLHFPILDRSAASAGTMWHVLDALDESIAEGKPVYVHCFAGIGRTGTAVGCYLQRHGLTTRETVMGRIAELRRGMLVAMAPSPHTPEQVAMVEQWPKGG